MASKRKLFQICFLLTKIADWATVLKAMNSSESCSFSGESQHSLNWPKVILPSLWSNKKIFRNLLKNFRIFVFTRQDFSRTWEVESATAAKLLLKKRIRNNHQHKCAKWWTILSRFLRQKIGGKMRSQNSPIFLKAEILFRIKRVSDCDCSSWSG